MTLGKFFPLIFKSWLLTYAVKIGEIGEIPPAKEYFISTVYVHLCIAISTNETSLQPVSC